MGMSQRSALVIGGTRNLGPDIVAALVEAGYEVTVLHRGMTLAAPLPPGVRRVLGDRSRAEALGSVLTGSGYDAVVDTTLYNGPDAAVTGRLFAGRTGRYVMISTGQVYLVRHGVSRPFHESDYEGTLIPAPERTRAFDYENWTYGVDKRAAEDALRAAALPLTVLRLPMVHSIRDPYQRLHHYWARARDGGPVLIPDEDSHLPIRHVFGRDVVRAVMAALAASRDGAYNVGQDEDVSITEFLTMIGARARRVPRAAMAELLPKCSPFSGTWMSSLDNTLGKEHLGLRYRRFADYVPELLAALPGTPPDGYLAQRERELRL